MLGRAPRQVFPILKRHSLSVSFIPTGSIFQYEADLLSQKENEKAVPNPQDLSDTPSLYTDIIHPRDVCDLTLNPNFEDLVITTLVPKCPVSGVENYPIVSKSSVTGSNLLFGTIAAKWLQDINKNILKLLPLKEADVGLTYTHGIQEKIVEVQFGPEVLESAKNIANFYSAVTEASIENITHFLLAQTGLHHQWVYEYILNNVEQFNPITRSNFVAQLLDQMGPEPSVSLAQSFARFYSELISVTGEGGVLGFSMKYLDRLAYMTALGSELTIASAVLHEFVRKRTAPSKATFDLYLKQYYKEDMTRVQILKELAPFKPILFHHGLTPTLLRVLLHVTTTSYDLHHLVRLARDSGILREYGADIMAKLAHIQREENVSEIIRGVQTTNLARSILQAGSPVAELKSKLETMLVGAGVQADLDFAATQCQMD